MDRAMDELAGAAVYHYVSDNSSGSAAVLPRVPAGVTIGDFSRSAGAVVKHRERLFVQNT
ncbi:hypothetical protein [Massilia sp. METH4]|uniref:hypothetical protein n=1 Tax=Massilia sp. METH4 TaxID=3123041 RepID=UPI0030CBC93E